MFIKKWFLQDETDGGDTGGGGGDGAELSLGQTLDASFDTLGEEIINRDEPVVEKEPAKEVKVDDKAPAKIEGKVDDKAVVKTGKAVPKSWKSEWHPHWDSIPDQVKDIIEAREEDFLNGAKGYEGDRTYAKAIRDAVKPFEGLLKAQGVTDHAQAYQYLLAAHAQLAQKDPAKRLAYFQTLADIYDIDKAGLTTALQAAPSGAQQDPVVKQLLEKVNNLEGTLNGEQQRRLTEAKAMVDSEVETFAKDPSHPYFNDLANDIAVLLQGSDTMTMQEAYDRAVWGNPATRAKEQARVQKDTEAAIRKEAEEKADKARKARGTQVRGAENQDGPTDLLGSIDDTMRETYRTIHNRQ